MPATADDPRTRSYSRCCRRWAAAAWSAGRSRSRRRSRRRAERRWSPAPAADSRSRSSVRAGATSFCPLETKKPWGILRNATRLAAIIRAEHVDIVHARSRAPAWSAWLASRRTGAHFITTYHGTYGEDVPLKRHYNAVMARGERVIAISRHIASLLGAAWRARGAHPGHPSRRRSGGVRSSQRRGGPHGPAGTGMAACPDGHATVVLPGRLTRWKGQAVLIEALARMEHREVCACWSAPIRGASATPPNSRS